MGGRDGMSGGTGGRPGSSVFFGHAGGGMGVKGDPADIGHPEHAGLHPFPAGFNRLAWALVSRKRVLEQVQDPPGAVGSPYGKGLVISPGSEVGDLLVKGRYRHNPSSHDTPFTGPGMNLAAQGSGAFPHPLTKRPVTSSPKTCLSLVG
jgi:hypothetical protein